MTYPRSQGHMPSYVFIRKLLMVLGIFTLIFLLFALYKVNTIHEEIDTETAGWSSDTKNWERNRQETKRKLELEQLYMVTPLPDLKYTFNHVESSSSKNDTPALAEEVTVVTMYLNLGVFQKGEIINDNFTPKMYRRWMKSFAALRNPVVAFFDEPDDKEYFDNLRRRLGPNHTKSILVNRSDLWAFSLLDKISRIFKKPGYPKYHPNTVIPEYSCAMNAKYEFMTIATSANYFQSKYFAWLDLGLFRMEVMSDSLPFFEIWLPPNFNSSTVSYTEVFKREPRYKTKGIVFSNAVWVCGCFFIGEVSVMATWSEQYMRATEALIYNHDIMATDQQVLYVLYNWGHPKVGIQTYRRSDTKYNEWFYLGYLCKEQGDKRRQGLLR